MSAVRRAGLPVVAVVLVAGVLGAQLRAGGGDFAPTPPADPCVERPVDSRADGIDGLTEQLVLLGVDAAACRLDVSRESLTLGLAQSQEPTDAEIDALRAGLHDAVDRMEAAGTLPPASELVDEALDQADLNGFLEAAIRALPDSVIDSALTTDDVLHRAVDELDLRALLDDLARPDDLQARVQDAVTQAVRDALVDRVRNLF